MSDTRCPQCGAVLPANAEWCTLCYFNLRQQAVPPAPAAPAPDQGALQPPLVQQPPLVAQPPLVPQPPLVQPPAAPPPPAPQLPPQDVGAPLPGAAPVAPPQAPPAFTAAPMTQPPVAQPPVAQPPAAFAPSAMPVSPAGPPAVPPATAPAGPPAAGPPVVPPAAPPLGVPEGAPPAVPGMPAPEPTWPCLNCGASVPMSLDHCAECGAGFLSAASHGHSIRVPGFGDVGRLASGQKLMLGVLVTVGLMIVILLVFTIGGKVL